MVNPDIFFKIYTNPARLNQDSLYIPSSQAYRVPGPGVDRPARLLHFVALCDCQVFIHNGIEWRNSPF